MLNTARRWLPIAAALLAAALGPAHRGLAADCNRNGVDDHAEVTGGQEPDCDGNGIPDGCDIAPVNFGLVARESPVLDGEPLAIVPADLDGDGSIDLGVATFPERVRVLWNRGTGTFPSSSAYPARIEVPAIQAGDMDGDGRNDLVIAALAEITLLLNQGDRMFSPATIVLGSDAHLRALVVADLDGDGDLDIACAAAFEAIILRNGGGADFTGSPESIPIGSSPVTIAAARIDGDDPLDLVTANFLDSVQSGSVSILLNRGDGTFLPPRNFGVGIAPLSLAAGDLDRDGKTDIVTANAGQGDFSILLGLGDGTLAEGRSLEAASPPLFVALQDIDTDGDPDLVSAREGDVGAVSLSFNQGDATFTKPFELPTGSRPTRFSIEDVTGDGRVDISVVETVPSGILLFGGALVAYDTDCDASGVPDSCELGGRDCNGNRHLDPCDIASGVSRDCDRNGVPDECEIDCNDNETPDSCDLALGTSPDCNRNGVPDECDLRSVNLVFDSGVAARSDGLLRTIRTADLDEDGYPDLFGARSDVYISILWNRGDGSFERAEEIPAGFPADIAAGDLDGDGDLDLAVAGGTGQFLVLSQEGPRSFHLVGQFHLSVTPSRLICGDLDDDGDLDAAVVGPNGGTLDELWNDGHASFSWTGGLPMGVSPPVFQLVDLDGDGALDLIGNDRDSGFLAVHWNERGRFQQLTLLKSSVRPWATDTEDIDGDGDLDMVASTPAGTLFAFQEPRRTFSVSERFADIGLGGVTEDLDGDGDPDLSDWRMVEDGKPRMTIWRNMGAGTFEESMHLSLPLTIPVGMVTGDYDGDGLLDIASAGQTCSPECSLETEISIFLNRSPLATSLDANRNGRPDECDPGAFHRGDADGDGTVNLADAVFTLRSLFQGGPQPGCAEAADADNDGSVGVSDPVSVLEFLFRGGPPPAAPGPPPRPCGLDTDPPGSPADLGCATYTSC